MDHFCPNCKFFMGADQLVVCPKCGYRLRRDHPPASEGLLKDFQDVAQRRCAEEELDGPAYKCPDCGNRLRFNLGDALQFDLLGKEMTIQAIKSLHMNISKKAVTQIHIEFDSWDCVKGHKFYTDFKESVKRLCPVCKGPMVKFGSEVLSCKKCRVNLTKDSFVFIEPEQLMLEQGYRRYTQAFECDSPPEGEPQEPPPNL